MVASYAKTDALPDNVSIDYRLCLVYHIRPAKVALWHRTVLIPVYNVAANACASIFPHVAVHDHRAGAVDLHRLWCIVPQPLLRALLQGNSIVAGKILQGYIQFGGGLVDIDLVVKVEPVRQGHFVEQQILGGQRTLLRQTIPGG